MLTRLGKIEQQMIKHLALYPRQNAQEIQRNLGIPDKNYATVRNALKSLEKLDLVKSEPKLSKKGVPIKAWLLSNKGLDLSLVYFPDLSSQELDSIINNYTQNEKSKQMFKIMHEELGTQLTLRMLAGFVTLDAIDQTEDSGFAQFMLFAGLTKTLEKSGAGFSKEDEVRLKSFLKRFMGMNKKTKLLYAMMEKLKML